MPESHPNHLSESWRIHHIFLWFVRKTNVFSIYLLEFWSVFISVCLERWRTGELPKYLCGLLYIIVLRSRCVRVLSRVLHNFRFSFRFAFGYRAMSGVIFNYLPLTSRVSIIWNTRSLLYGHRYGYLYLDVGMKSIQPIQLFSICM